MERVLKKIFFKSTDSELKHVNLFLALNVSKQSRRNCHVRELRGGEHGAPHVAARGS